MIKGSSRGMIGDQRYKHSLLRRWFTLFSQANQRWL